MVFQKQSFRNTLGTIFYEQNFSAQLNAVATRLLKVRTTPLLFRLARHSFAYLVRDVASIT